MSQQVVHVIGARPNFVKAAPVISALAAQGVDQRIIHTGQHYDALMSDVFFADLRIPEPDVNLNVGSGTHAQQTAATMVGLEEALPGLDPALVVVYGDVNSTVAAALVTAKLGIPLAHVEAGLRSFDMTMPEEVNRRLTDQVADLLFVTSPEGMAYLGNEGIDPARAHFVGNPMIDTLLAAVPRLDAAAVRQRLGLGDDDYGVVTLHRPANVDDPDRAREIVVALTKASEHVRLLVPLHPRGRARLGDLGLFSSPRVEVIDPLGYLDFTSLVSGARVVITDSGGVQEETTMLGVPCVTVRPNTERPVTVTHGTNELVEPEAVPMAVEALMAEPPPRDPDGPPLWDGKAGPRIAAIIRQWLAQRASS